jgi:hypothetical protein
MDMYGQKEDGIQYCNCVLSYDDGQSSSQIVDFPYIELQHWLV